MSETVERIYPEAVNLRSMARWERKQGNVELAGVLEGTADLYERTASDLESATNALRSHSAAVIEQHAEITKLKSQLEEARAKAIEECASIAKAHKGSAPKRRLVRLGTLPQEAQNEIVAEERGEDIASEIIEKSIRALLSAPTEARTALEASNKGGE